MPVTGQVKDFLAALRNLSLVRGDGWGLSTTHGACLRDLGMRSLLYRPGFLDGKRWAAPPDVNPDPSVYLPDLAVVASTRTACEIGSPYGAGIPGCTTLTAAIRRTALFRSRR